jgi:predicted membrane protein
MAEASNKRLFPGLLLIVIGTLFLLENIGVIPYEVKRYVFSWQGWIIMIGSVFLISRPNQPTGLIMITVGFFFLIPEILDISFDTRLYWPVILILIGIFFLVRQQRSSSSQASKGESSMDWLDDTSVFGGGDVVVTSENFKGGKATYVFGGSTVNLSRAKLSEGKAVIDIFAMFGGCTFIVPSDWNVRVETTAIFGGFSDNRKPNPDTVIDLKKELIIKGTVLFGGGEVKNF